MNHELNIHKRAIRLLAAGVSGLVIALSPAMVLAGRPEIDCNTLSEQDSMKFFELSGRSAEAAQEKKYDEALQLGLEAMAICTTDAYTELTIGHVYQLTGDCPNAYYHFDNLMQRSPEYQKENAAVYKDLKKYFKDVSAKCGEVVTLEVTCEEPDMQLSVTGMGDISTIKCPFYGKVMPGVYSFMASRDGFMPRKETVTAAEGTGATVKIPRLKKVVEKGTARIICPRNASKFYLTRPDGTTDEYVCPHELDLPVGTYQVKLGGSADAEVSTFEVKNKEVTSFNIPAVAKSKCSAAPLANNTSAPAAGALMALLAGLGISIRRRRDS